MNLALITVVLAALLTPTLLFLYCAFKGRHSRGMPKLSIIEYFLLSAALSIFFHATLIWMFRLNVDYPFIAKMILGLLDKSEIEIKSKHLGNYFFGFVLYIFSACLIAIFLGILVQRFITKRNYRVSFFRQLIRKKIGSENSFRYYDSWWYYFRDNEYNDNYKFLGNDEPLIIVEVLMCINGIDIIYSGILKNYELKENTDQLCRVYLISAEKRIVTKDEEKGDLLFKSEKSVALEPQKGILCIPYEHIVNMYVRFMSTVPIEFHNFPKNIEQTSEELGLRIVK